jgi:hypothetical protein
MWQAVEQRSTQLCFQRCDRMRQRGLRHVQHPRRVGEAAVLNDSQEVLKLSSLHSRSVDLDGRRQRAESAGMLGDPTMHIDVEDG